jgi:hypothetical protein
LRGDDSLAQLLARRLGIRSRTTLPPLTIAQVLSWAMDHQIRTGRLPNSYSGPVRAVLGETWQKIDDCLRKGRRGLPRSGSLAQLLAQHRPGARR